MDHKELLIAAGAFLIFFIAMFISMDYTDSLVNDCKIKGLASGRPAIEIQAVCSRR
jgi:hypothetical protein